MKKKIPVKIQKGIKMPFSRDKSEQRNMLDVMNDNRIIPNHLPVWFNEYCSYGSTSSP
jgi:hypothetical protein